MARTHLARGHARRTPLWTGAAAFAVTAAAGLAVVSLPGTLGRPAGLAASRASDSAVVLSDSAQGWNASLRAGSVALTGARGAQLTLSSPSVGRGSALRPLSRLSAPARTRSTVSFSSPGLSEWFAHGAGGLEQGFTLDRRPAGGGPLVISQAVSGTTAGQVTAGGGAVTFNSRVGVVRYQDLAVTDAQDRRVPARLGLAAGRLTITVTDTHAAYPLRVDPVMIAPVTQTPAANADTSTNPTTVAFSPGGGLLATSNIEGLSSLSIFSVNSNGQVTPITQSSTFAGDFPDGVAFSPSGDLLAVANDTEADDPPVNGSLSILQVNSTNGQVTPVTQNSASNATTGEEPQSVAFSPDGLLATVNLESDNVSLFRVSDPSGQLTPIVPTAAANFNTGSIPWSVAFSPNGQLLAVANKGSDTVSVFTVNPTSGQLTPVTQSSATDADTGTGPLSVAFSSSGGLLAVANGGSNTVSMFTVDPTTGQLTPVTQSPTTNGGTGGDPYAATFSPDGGVLAVANAGSNNVSLFSVDEATGALTPDPQTPAGNADTGTGPHSVAFSPCGGLLATANYTASSVSLFTVSGTPANVALTLGPSSIAANGTSSSVATATVLNSCGKPSLGAALTISSSGAQKVGAVTAGSTPGTYQATIRSTTTPGTATITATDTSVTPNASASAILTQTTAPGGTGPGSGSGPVARATSLTGGDGVISATLSCPAGHTGCGTVRLKATVTEHLKGKKLTAVSARATKRRKKPRKPKKRKKVVVIASSGTVLSAGQTRKVTVKLNGTGRRLLTHFHKLRTLVTVTSGTKTIDKVTLTLRQPKKKKHHKRHKHKPKK